MSIVIPIKQRSRSSQCSSLFVLRSNIAAAGKANCFHTQKIVGAVIKVYVKDVRV